MSEMDPWTRQLLSVIVSQLCRTIGWHSISTTCLHVLVDVLHRYLKKLGNNIHDYTEQFNHTLPTLEELNLALMEAGVNIEDLKEYVDYVAPIPIKMKVPHYPLEKKSNLNFLKPGSREVVTRPVHIHEHLPAMRPELSEENYTTQDSTRNNNSKNSVLPSSTDTASASSTFEMLGENVEIVVNKKISNVSAQEVTRRVRELSCVMMTTSGFLSPSIEGKMPEARLPKMVHNVVNNENSVGQPPTAPVTPESKSEHKKSGHSKSSSKNCERKNRIEENHSINKDDINDESKTKKPPHLKEVSKLKILKPVVNSSIEPLSDASAIIRQERLKLPQIVLQKEPKIPKQMKSEKKVEKIHQEQQQQQTVISEKLTTEPNKQKLNIFRRISKVKEDRAESPISKATEDRSASINESIENVVKNIGEKDSVRNFPEKENPSSYSAEPIQLTKVAIEGKKIKRKKKKKVRDSLEPIPKKLKLNNEVIPNEIERPKPTMPEQPPPYPFFTQLPDSLETNYLIPRFTNPFFNMTKLDPNCPHPEMPNLPLPPPMMPTAFIDNLQRSPVKIVESDRKLHDPHIMLNISDKKLKKKMKKDKREKDKKKRDKKEKLKKVKLEEKKQDKLLKKEKNKERLKKKDKLNATVQKEEIPEDSSVPKIKLRIGGTNSPLPSPSGIQSPKINVSIVKQDDVPRHSEPALRDVREPSPELAKMPALVGKPAKMKNQTKITIEPMPMVEPITLSTKCKKVSVVSAEMKPKNKEKLTKSKKTEGAKSKPEPYYYDADGNQVWVCPTCGGPDDGSPMIGCDGCDAWYHWVCVGIKSAPESAKWFCGLCVSS